MVWKSIHIAVADVSPNDFNRTLFMKVRSSLKDADKEKGDVIVRRKGRLYVINKKQPRRKMRQG